MANTANKSFYQLFLLFLISLSLYGKAAFGYNNSSEVSDSKVRCIERERKALLKFKHGLEDDYDLLSSWGGGENNKECCKWWGIKCSNKTGHVTVLDLHMDPSAFFNYRNLRGELGHSLTELRHLRYLDLSNNIFSGKVPHQLGNLTSLQTLNLGWNRGLITGSLEWLSQLRFLRQLDLSTLNLWRTNWIQVISSLPFLQKLHLSFCGIGDSKPSSLLLSNSSSESLSVLDLSINGLTSSAYYWLFNVSKNLVSIDLRGNHLEGRIPEAFGEMIYLEDIDLALNFLEGGVPKSFKNLSLLRSLRLAGNLNLSESFPELLQKLSPGVEKSLESLDLSKNQFYGPLADLTRFSSLREICLNDNQLNGSALENIVLPPSLLHLDLSNNQITGNLLLRSFSESVDHLSRLEYLDLSNNQMSRLPLDLTVFSSLRELHLSKNKFTGNIPDTIGQLSMLKVLDLSSNKFKGNIPDRIGQLSELKVLDLSSNFLEGIPQSIGQLFKLENLDLSSNFLEGIPQSIGQLSKLENLDLSSNFLEGILSEVHFSKLFNLKELDVSFNSLTLKMSSDWSPTFQLNVIRMVNCSMGPHFPQWLKTQNNISWLDLSLNGISDTLPNWFWKDEFPKLEYLNLSYNQISGQLPELSQKFYGAAAIDLGSNNFSGPILSTPPYWSSLNLYKNKFTGSISFLCVSWSFQAESLDLSDNQFSGDLPSCWASMPGLVVLNLAKNKFTGQIPESLGDLIDLHALYLSDNLFVGEIPSSLKDVPELLIMDVGGNKLTGKIPGWIGTHLTSLVILSLRSNELHGNIPRDICQLSRIRVLDLSHNNITGRIPHCLNNFTSLVHKPSSRFDDLYIDDRYSKALLIEWKRQLLEYKRLLRYLKVIDLSCNKLVGQIPEEVASLGALISLNLSTNHLTGTIVGQIDQMEMLESLDLSRNQLSGKIPSGLASLNFLAVLDLSYNDLSGKIPSSNHLQTFEASSYIGNDELCGPPLKQCPWDALDTQPGVPEKNNNVGDEDDQFLTKEFYMSMGIGFVFGLWGVFVILLKTSWRNAYFGFLQNTNDWFYVTSRVYMARLKRMLNS